MQKRLRKALSVLLAVALLAGSLPGIPAFAGGGGGYFPSTIGE